MLVVDHGKVRSVIERKPGLFIREREIIDVSGVIPRIGAP